MFMASDHPETKAPVAGLLMDLGFDPLDAGGLRQSRDLEPYAMARIHQALYRGKQSPWALAALRPGPVSS